MDYKDFNINTNLTPPPWGATEQQMVQDVIDTLTKGTLQAGKQADGGHQHTQLVQPLETTDTAGNIVIAPAVSVDSAGISFIQPDSNDVEHTLKFWSDSAGGAHINGMEYLSVQGGEDLQIDASNLNINVPLGAFTVNGQPVGGSGGTIKGSGAAGYVPVFSDSTTITNTNVTAYSSAGKAYIATSSAAMVLNSAAVSHGYYPSTGNTGTIIKTDVPAETLILDSTNAYSGIYIANRFPGSGWISSIDFQGSGINITGKPVNIDSGGQIALAPTDNANQTRFLFLDATSANGGTIRLTGDSNLSIISPGDLNITTNASTSGMIVLSPSEENIAAPLTISTDSGANVNITAVTNGLGINASGNLSISTGGQLILVNLPTSSAGLGSGALYNASGFVKVA